MKAQGISLHDIHKVFNMGETTIRAAAKEMWNWIFEIVPADR